MTGHTPFDLSDLLTAREAAQELRRSPLTLKYWRSRQVGPCYVVIRGRPAYPRPWLREFTRAQVVEPRA